MSSRSLVEGTRRRYPVASAAAAASASGAAAAPSSAPPSPDPATRILRVLVVDDHELLRAGTRQILERAAGFEVIGEAADGEDAVRIVRSRQPDVVLLDIRLPDVNGIEVARRLLAGDEPPVVIVLSAYDDDHYVQAALAAGVSGYLLKTLPAHELVARIRQAWDDPDHPGLVPPSSTNRDGGGSLRLTAREREVVTLVARGLANKQIARRLDISPRTVEGHLNRVFERVGATSRTELVHLALTQGLLFADERVEGAGAHRPDDTGRSIR
ncbi:MAG: response regulator transcription factor [Acidimicrobiales bacterium]|nr:response regulator transcription factor [Acidimicrobiales bacterium]